jgi:hypothetical protein
MVEESKSDLLRPPGSSEEDYAPVNVDAILLSILGRGAERFGMAAVVLRASASSPRVSPGFEREGPQSASRSMIDFTLVPAPKP